MKNIRSISIVALVIVALATAVIAKSEFTASIQNNSTQCLGTVTLLQSSGAPVYVNVPGPGQFNVNISTGITWAIVNGQSTAQGSRSTVTLSNGKKVNVSVDGIIIVATDQQEGL